MIVVSCMMEGDNREFLNELSKKLRCKHELEKLKCEELERVRRKWYTAKLVLSAAQDASTEQPSTETSDSLAAKLTSAECEELVKVSSRGSQTGLLGIPTAPETQNTDNSNDEHTKLVRAQIHKKLLSISQFYQPSSVGSGANLLNAKALQLHNVVRKDKDALDANREEIERLKYQRVLVLQKLQQTHSKNLRLLNSLLEKHCLETLPEETTQETDQIAANTEALAAKIGLIEKELYADTYTPQTAKELSAIRSHLNRMLSEVQQKLKTAEQEYVKCLSAGTEFQRVAKEYMEIKKDIEARAWALNELKVATQHKI